MDVTTILFLTQIPYYIVIFLAIKEIRKFRNDGLNYFD
jgi:hypothetical protein